MPQAAVATVKIQPDSIELGALGQTQQLSAIAQDDSGTPVTGVSYVWASSNPAAVSVNASGVATAHGNGAAVITATSVATNGPGVEGIAHARVKRMITAIVVTPDIWPTSQVWVGARRQFSAFAVDANGNEMSGVPIEWSVSNTSRARVDETGLVTVLGAGANTRVIATARGLNDSVSFTANPEGSDVPGYMYTAWFARTDIAPALLINGAIALSETYVAGNDLPWTYPASPWTGFKSPWPHNTIEKFQYQGNRIGLLTDVANGVGTVRVMDRREDWTILALANAQDFALEGNRIGVLLEDGRLRVKTGIHGGWTTAADRDVTQFQLEGSRIGAIFEDETARVTDNAGATWELLDAAGVTQFQLEGNRIGVLTRAGEFRVKDGLGSAFTDLASSGARQFALEGNRIAMLHENGTLQAMDGINGAWTVIESEPIRQFVLEGSLIGVLLESGVFRVHNGIGGEVRTFATAGVREIQIQGSRIGALSNDNPASSAGVLRIWPNFNATSSDSTGMSDFASVTQFRLIVDNPVPPFRTTTAGYNAGQARCDELYWTPGCWPTVIPPIGVLAPVPQYGLLCGANRPGDGEMGRAVGSVSDGGHGGPIDAMDAMCMHHDLAGSWYPELPSGVSSYNPTQSCVVKYALRYGQLTRDGVVVADGSSSYAERIAAWAPAGMLHMHQAMEYFHIFTDGCSEAALARFDAETGATH